MEEPKVVDVYNGTLFARHDKAITCVNSQCVLQHAQDLHKIKPINIPAWIAEGFLKFHLELISIDN